MKNMLLLSLLFSLVTTSWAQENVNLKRGFAAEGYDVVSYFNNKALKGEKKFVAIHDGVNYKFSSQTNLDIFKDNPSQYIPQYGGFCAYAIAKNGKKVGVDPKTFTITEGKLYLFYNSFGVNTLDKWNEEGAARLKTAADAKWKTIVTAN